MIGKLTHDEVIKALDEWSRTWILPGLNTPECSKQRREAVEELLYALTQIPGNRSYMGTVANLYTAWQQEKR